jgi:hypothetical protein
MAFPRQGQDCHRFRLYEDGDPTVSLVTREIAGFSGGDFLSRVINRLAADRRGAVELWMSVLQSNRANSICSWSLGQPFQVGNEQQAADSGPDETTSQPLPLDLLVAQDSALSSNHGEPAAARIDEVQNLMPELPSSLALRKSKAHRNSLSCKGAPISQVLRVDLSKSIGFSCDQRLRLSSTRQRASLCAGQPTSRRIPS